MQTQHKGSQKELPERGLLNLITQKLESGSTPESVEAMLLRAGLDEAAVREAVRYAAKNDTLRHQREAEENDFLPPLNKAGHIKKDLDSVAGSISRVINAEVGHKGLFHGRLRRKDFIIGLLFFFGFGFILATIAVSWAQFFTPELAQSIENMILADTAGVWLLFIPFLFAPITLMVLSLITRRLHNLGFPGWMSLLYLLAFISPFGPLGGYAFFGMHFVLLVLMIVMLTVKGHPNPNKHGALPPSEGAIFTRVFGK